MCHSPPLTGSLKRLLIDYAHIHEVDMLMRAAAHSEGGHTLVKITDFPQSSWDSICLLNTHTEPAGSSVCVSTVSIVVMTFMAVCSFHFLQIHP